MAGPWWRGPLWRVFGSTSVWWTLHDRGERIEVEIGDSIVAFSSLEDAQRTSTAVAFADTGSPQLRELMVIAWGVILVYAPKIRSDRARARAERST